MGVKVKIYDYTKCAFVALVCLFSILIAPTQAAEIAVVDSEALVSEISLQLNVRTLVNTEVRQEIDDYLQRAEKKGEDIDSILAEQSFNEYNDAVVEHYKNYIARILVLSINKYIQEHNLEILINRKPFDFEKTMLMAGFTRTADNGTKSHIDYQTPSDDYQMAFARSIYSMNEPPVDITEEIREIIQEKLKTETLVTYTDFVGGEK